MRVSLLVPEPAVAGARLGVELLAQQRGGLLITLVMGELPERQHGLARIDVVEAVILRLVTVDFSVRRDERTDRVFGEFNVVRVVRLFVQFEQRQREQAGGVIPFGLAARFPDQTVTAARHFRIGQPQRPLQRRGAGKFFRRRVRRTGSAGEKARTRTKNVMNDHESNA